jgi:hypothetical protein
MKEEKLVVDGNECILPVAVPTLLYAGAVWRRYKGIVSP